MSFAWPTGRRAFVLTLAAATLAVPLAATGAAVAAPLPTGDSFDNGMTSCTGTVTKVCTQTVPAHYAYIPGVPKSKGSPGRPGSTATVPPSVTVSQTTGLVYQTVQVSWKNFTPSFVKGLPSSSAVSDATFYDVGVFECRGTAPVTSPVDASSLCYPTLAANASLGKHGLGNAVHGFTAADGTGSTQITVETGQENDLLGCSQSSPCSLAIVPNWGGSQLFGRPSATSCAKHNTDVGTVNNASNANDANIGLYCSWSDRIVVPLSFSPTPASCGTESSFSSEGSPMLNEAMVHWRPSFCQGAERVTFGYDSGVTEFQARSDFTTPPTALSESVDAAFTSQPANDGQAAQRAFTYAPVANTGVVLAFVIDDPTTGKLDTHVVLDARLVAKMLTQSYSLTYSMPACEPGTPTASQTGCGDYDNVTGSYKSHEVPCSASLPQGPTCDPAVAGNPATIVADPEFRVLNPDLFPAGQPPRISAASVSGGQFLPILTDGNTDLTYALTSWLDADPDAHAFLQGRPDIWGMHVNTYYKDVAWPSDHLEALDPGYTDSTRFAGWGTMQVASSSVHGLDNVVSSLLINRPTASDTADPTPTPCGAVDGSTNPPCTYGRYAPELPGQRVLFAVMDAADAANYGFGTATLVNLSGHAVDVSPSSVNAALRDTATNSDGITTHPDVARQTADAAAYPMAVTDYLMTPTCGLAASKAGGLHAFLQRTVSTTAQTNGSQTGQLAAGYTPLSTTQRSQADAAAAAVLTQRACATKRSTPGAHPSSSAASTAPGGTSGSPAPRSSASGSTAAGRQPVKELAYGQKASGFWGLHLLVPALVLGLILLLLSGPGFWWTTQTASGAAAVRRVRTWVRL